MGGKYEIGSATTTDFTNQVPDFIVESKALDNANPQPDEYYWYFDKATEYLGYYYTIPEISSAANALATWAVSRGYETEDTTTKVILDNVFGMGKDTFETIMFNHEVIKLIVGDAFCEVKRETAFSRCPPASSFSNLRLERV